MEGLIPVLDAAVRRSCDAIIQNSEPISGIELMERASWSMVRVLLAKFGTRNFHFLCGPGNNGGDGLAMARILSAKGYGVRVSHFLFSGKSSAENSKNAALFQKFRPENYRILGQASELSVAEDELLVDSLLGSGLNENLRPDYRSIVDALTLTMNTIVAVDIPTGMFSSGVQKPGDFMRADHVLCVQFPPLSFFYPEHKIAFTICDAGIKSVESDTHFLSAQEPYKSQILSSLPPKNSFSHKGDQGHVLLVGGNKGMHGAIALSAAACLHIEPGNLTVMGPQELIPYLAPMPRAMHRTMEFNSAPADDPAYSNFSVAAIGPGLGQYKNAGEFLENFLKDWARPLLLDADALNLIAANKDLWKDVKAESIITPHPKEFERLFGKSTSSEEAIKKAQEQANKLGIYILLKGTYSMFVCPDGHTFFNGGANPRLARGGSGDELTGRIAGIWAKTKNVKTAGILGMYISGLRG